MRLLPEKDESGLRDRMRGSMCILDVFLGVILATTQNGTRTPEIAKVHAGPCAGDVLEMHPRGNYANFGGGL